MVILGAEVAIIAAVFSVSYLYVRKEKSVDFLFYGKNKCRTKQFTLRFGSDDSTALFVCMAKEHVESQRK